MADNGYIAFITPEIAIAPELHTYTGGLGFLSGSYAMSAHPKARRIVCVSTLPRKGYYDQYIEERGDGRLAMGIRFQDRWYEDILLKTGEIIQIPIHNHSVSVEILLLPAGRFGNCDIIFLDADIEQNDALSRLNTQYLYGGSESQTGANIERTIAQSLILGRGAVYALARMNIPVQTYHINESYGAFAGMELLRQRIAAGLDKQPAINRVRQNLVFTTHTPVRAGNPEYPLALVEKLWGQDDIIGRDVLEQIGGHPFNMTAACIRLANKVNAVSARHMEIAKKMWHWVREDDYMTYVTNGVNREYWQYLDFRDANDIATLEEAKRRHKRELCAEIAAQGKSCFNENILTLCWARRFAAYKRPRLLFYDMEWIARLLAANKLQIIFSGKPHPDDFQMIAEFDYILNLIRELPNLVVLPEYDLALSKKLKGGVDLWLNTPRAPEEACGTSGMSAAMNGCVNMSTPDGWMCEADPSNCLLFGTRYPLADQDAYDLTQLKGRLEEAIDMYMHKKNLWYALALAGKKEMETSFTSDRMLTDYERVMYGNNGALSI